MELFIIVLVFIYGLVLGSFFNVVGLRWVYDEKITGRSHCPNCKATLHWYNLVPLFSYLFQGGKCHNCKVKISLIYPVMELLTALSYVLVYLVCGFSLDFIIGIIFMTMILISGVTDFKEGFVLDKVVIPPTIIILILTLFKPNSLILNIIPGVVVFLLLLIAVKMEKLGGGDVLIIAGVFIVHGLMLAPITMLVTSITTLIFMLIYNKKRVPFIPFWVLGNIMTYIIAYTGVLDNFII